MTVLTRPPAPAAAMAAPAPLTVLRTLPELPGSTLSWPTSPAAPAVQGSLALDTELHVPPDATPTLTVVPGAGPSCPGRSAGGVPAGVATHAMRARAARFAMAVVEAAGGDRPVVQLERWTTAQVYDAVAELAAMVGLTTDAESRARTDRPRLLSLRVSHPAGDVAEVCGHVRHGRRSRALALRLEHRLDRWVCTALELG